MQIIINAASDPRKAAMPNMKGRTARVSWRFAYCLLTTFTLSSVFPFLLIRGFFLGSSAGVSTSAEITAAGHCVDVNFGRISVGGLYIERIDHLAVLFFKLASF